MRRWVYLGFLLFVLASQAGQLPLTVAEISLMLRAGYSSNTVMQELATRRFVDVVDDAKEKTLVNAGASAELLAALKNGAYALSADKTAAVLQQMATAEERRQVQAEISRKADGHYQAQVARERAAKSPRTDPGVGAIAGFLKGDLVQYRDGSVVHVDDTTLANKKLVAFYFSAEWCGPCRKFTPQLLEYYKRVSPEHPEFEIVFYSHDRSAADFERYLREANMPWLAIDFSKLKGKEALTKNAGPGIPSLVVVDSMGNLISSSYSGGQFFGPQKVLADLDAIFAGKSPERLARAD
jgi:nucleoredoxin